MTSSPNWLPNLVLFESVNGIWTDYLNAIYQYFKNDFVHSKPYYPGKRVGLKRHPLYDNKEYTFWHFIQEGPEEEGREPAIRRCERIRWPRPIIEAIRSDKVCTWNTKRGTHKRIVIALEDFSYVVVLEDRSEYVLPWTAYTIEKCHRRKKLMKEYKESQKADAAS